MQDSAFLGPVVRDVEGAHIAAHRVDAVVLTIVVISLARSDIRRGEAVRIIDIDIERLVIAKHLPVRRNRNVIPLAHIVALFEESERTALWFGHEMELPSAVEALESRGDWHGPRSVVISLVSEHLTLGSVSLVVGAAIHLVDGKHRLVLPYRRIVLHYLVRLAHDVSLHHTEI